MGSEMCIRDRNKPKYSLGEAPIKDNPKNSRWNLSADSDCCRSTGPVDRQRLDFRPLGKLSTGPVDRSPKQRVTTRCRSTGPVDRNKQRALLYLPVDWDGRPMCTMHIGACRLTARSTDRAVLLCQRSNVPVDRTRPKNRILKGVLKSKFFGKFSLNG